MREKIFYVINLDKNRIGLLSLLLLGLLFSFFFLGVSVGRGNTKIAQGQIKNDNKLTDSTQEKKDTENSSEQNALSSEEGSTASNSENTSTIANATEKSESSLNPSSQEQSVQAPEEITLSNKAPNSANSQALGSQIVDLQSNNSKLIVPSENTTRQEQLYKNETKPVTSYSKKTPKKSTTVVTSPSQTGIYTVQVAAFTDKSVADNYAKKINAENPKLKVKAFVKKRGRNYLVRFGADNSKDQLRKLISLLKLDSNIKKTAIIVKNS